MKSNTRLNWLDSIRGIAALIVVIFHIWMLARLVTTKENYFYKFMEFINYDVFDLGKIGVVLFFAVSGFIIPYSLLRYKENPLKRFAISRFFRLYPAYWLSLLFVLIFMSNNSNVLNTLANFTMFQKFIGQDDMLGVYWTLQIELIFYFLCATLFGLKLLQNHRTAYTASYFFMACAFLLSVVRFFTEIKLPVALPLALSVMFFGMTWMRYILKEKGSSKKMVYTLLLFILIALIPTTYLAYNQDYGFEEIWYRYTFSYYTALIMFLSMTTFLKINNRLFLYLGKISYSLYLVHLIVADVVIKQGKLDNLVPNIYIQMVFVLIVSILLASLVYHLIEKPFIGLGRKMIKKLPKTDHQGLLPKKINVT